MMGAMEPSAPTAATGLYRVVPAVLAALSVAIWSVGSPERGQGADQAVEPSAIESSCVAELQSAYAAVEAGKAEDALRHYRAAVGMATSDVLRFQSLLGLGSTYAALQQYDTAAPPLERARDLAPDNAEVWYTLGTVYSAAGRAEDALRAFGEAARLEPGMAAARADICRLLSGLGRYERGGGGVPQRGRVWILPTWRRGLGSAWPVTSWVPMTRRRRCSGRRSRSSPAISARSTVSDCRSTYAGDRDGALAQYLALRELDPALAQDLYRRIFP